ncbi:WXG100 family type VII secretion target [Prauserella halophila]|uniref:WXG100 family type VII secretion target n=1 Tax=Prauserella halophila TaxID=185641 RepID=A0ABN1WBS4_9PSEU|nr:hypothetical protein [Prauserella halophila]MCP2238553.1 hypothetical protein [Prauserella halophila]
MDDRTTLAVSGMVGDEARTAAVQQVAKSEFTEADLNEMKALLDDPNVSSEHRGQMLMALSNAGVVSHQEIYKYSSKYGYDAEDIKDGGEAPLENIYNGKRAFRRAQRESHQGEISDAKGSLQDLKSYSSSDQIIDKAKLIVKLFSEFHPKYTEVKSLGYNAESGEKGQREMPRAEINNPNSSQGEAGASAKYSVSGNTPDDIRSGLDEFRGIEFHCFWQDSNVLSDTHKKVSEAKESLHGAWKDGTSEWVGDAKDAASQRNNTINENAGDLSQALNTASDSVMAGIETVRECVAEYVKAVLDMYGNGRISGLVPSDIDTLIKVGQEFRGGIQQVQEKTDPGFLESMTEAYVSYNLLGMLSPSGEQSPFFDFQDYKFADTVDIYNAKQELARGRQALEDAEAQLKAFVAAYEQKAEQFHAFGQQYVQQGVQTNYSDMINALNKNLGQAFGDQMGKGGDKSAVPGENQTVPTGGPPMTGGNPPPSAGPTPSSSSVPPPAASVDPAAAGEQLPDQSGNGQPKPGEAGEGKNPVTGGKLETDPETGEPYPIDPATGEAVKDAVERDTLTVEQGDKKFEFAEPDANGEMAISVDDGNGPLKDYKLDFGGGDDASGGAQPGGQTDGGPGQSAGPGQGAGPGQPGQGQDAGQGQTPGEQGRQDFGPQGSGDGAADGTQDDGPSGARGEKVHTPDEDGKIRIEDGDTEIVAEQPDGPDGPTKVTVDDGKGEPTTYTLGEEETSGSGAGSGGGIRPGGGGVESAARGMAADGPDMDELGSQDGAPRADSDSGSGTGSGTAGAGAAAEGSAPGGTGSVASASEAGQAGAGPDLGAGGAGSSIPDGAGSAGDGGAAGPDDGGARKADTADAAQSPGGDAGASGENGADDATAPASSLGSSLGDGALGGGAGEMPGDSSLAEAGMGEDTGAGDDSGDGGGPGGSGDSGGGAGGSGMGGGMMGGGMGGAGGGGGGGGDEERQSQFILDAVSELFGEVAGGNHITGTIGEGAETAVSFGR